MKLCRTLRIMTNESQLDTYKDQLYVRVIDGEKYVIPILIDNSLMAILNKDAMVIIGDDIIKYGKDRIISLSNKYYDNQSTSLEYFKSNSNSITVEVNTVLIASSERIQNTLESRATTNGVFWRKSGCTTATRKTVSEIFITTAGSVITSTVRTSFFKRGFLGSWVSASDNVYLSFEGTYDLYKFSFECNCYTTTNLNVYKQNFAVSSISETFATTGSAPQLLNISIYCLAEFDGDCIETPDLQNCWLN